MNNERRQGFVLILVLVIIAFLALLAVTVAGRANVQGQRLSLQELETQKASVRQSAIHLIQDLLSQERSPALPTGWNRRWTVIPDIELNGKTQVLVLEDEEGKINLNYFLKYPAHDNRMKKFQAFYERFVKEHYVRHPGIQKTLLALPGWLRKRKARLEVLDELKGLDAGLKSGDIKLIAKDFGLIGRGLINVNTASEALLKSLLGNNAGDFIRFRGSTENPGDKVASIADVLNSLNNTSPEHRQKLTAELQGLVGFQGQYFKAELIWGKQLHEGMFFQRKYQEQNIPPGVDRPVQNVKPEILLLVVWKMKN